jgi:hypothetical protein
MATPASHTTSVIRSASQPSLHLSSASHVIDATSHTDNIRPGTIFRHPIINSAIIKHIPKSARFACAALLSDILQLIVRDCSNIESWSLLINFGTIILAKPPRSEDHCSLTSIIKKRTANYLQNRPTVCKMNLSQSHRLSKYTDDKLAKSITAKLEDGNVRAALRLLLCDDKPAEINDDTYAKLLERHPRATSSRPIAPLRIDDTPCFQVSESEVLKAARSFPVGSSGGPDGIRPLHITSLLNCKEAGAKLLTAITAFTNMLLKGNCPADVVPILFGGNLTALIKKSGGIRPIAVGYYWRRLSAKCANAYASKKLYDFFSPIQLGVGVSGGCEAAIHACRRYVASLPEGHVVVKLDFSNAFNSLHRDVMLEAVHDAIPEIYPFCHMSYSVAGSLKFGDRHIDSEEGIQQGDPLGPLLFCLAIQPILRTLSSNFVVGYMDDVTLGGASATVAQDVNTIINDGRAKGLLLNIAKCELISHSGLPSTSPLDQFTHVTPDNATLLGAPLTIGSAMDMILHKKLTELQRASDRLKRISSHDALVLLKASCGAPKLTHILRSSPCHGHSTLQEIDKVLHLCLANIANVDISDMQWLQSSLPIKAGGLGLRSAQKLALSCFLASESSTQQLQNLLLIHCDAALDIHYTDMLATWTSTFQPLPPPTGILAFKQRSWDQPSVDTSFATLLASQPDDYHRARLLAVAAPHSGDWLNVLPISSCGLRLDDEAIRIAVGLRLGANLCAAHDCICGSFVDCLGSHGLSCRRGVGRLARHGYINDLVYHALVRAEIPSSKEPVGLSRSDGKRPDGITLVPWTAGKNAIWDVTVVNTLAASYVRVGRVEWKCNCERVYVLCNSLHFHVASECDTRNTDFRWVCLSK